MKIVLETLSLICASLLISLMFVGQSYAVSPLDAAMGIWLFDETSGDTARDSSGKDNDGTINGATRVDGRFGKMKNL